ncbi:unnamed protein product [Pleuronectes platessa]|uniref:Uncharacterized protein n=1 Tax=Pleuronectes platessa TaxID=8262 RepID=A0A9N7Y9H3_PLEPL|nr:unnamed protein product [Pleuronectes platessa]
MTEEEKEEEEEEEGAEGRAAEETTEDTTLCVSVSVQLKTAAPLLDGTMDGEDEEVQVSRLQMERERDDRTPTEHKCPAVCDSLHSSVHSKENSPMMRAVLCAQVCKVYRFLTEDQRWLLVREQMSETPLSFSLPKQLLRALIHEHTLRVQEVKELGDLPPHWEGLRHDVINHCHCLIGCYQETLAELDKLSASTCFKSSSSRSDLHLQFVPTNLHSQRMEVTSPNSTGTNIHIS